MTKLTSIVSKLREFHSVLGAIQSNIRGLDRLLPSIKQFGGVFGPVVKRIEAYNSALEKHNQLISELVRAERRVKALSSAEEIIRKRAQKIKTLADTGVSRESLTPESREDLIRKITSFKKLLTGDQVSQEELKKIKKSNTDRLRRMFINLQGQIASEDTVISKRKEGAQYKQDYLSDMVSQSKAGVIASKHQIIQSAKPYFLASRAAQNLGRVYANTVESAFSALNSQLATNILAIMGAFSVAHLASQGVHMAWQRFKGITSLEKLQGAIIEGGLQDPVQMAQEMVQARMRLLTAAKVGSRVEELLAFSQREAITMPFQIPDVAHISALATQYGLDPMKGYVAGKPTYNLVRALGDLAAAYNKTLADAQFTFLQEYITTGDTRSLKYRFSINPEDMLATARAAGFRGNSSTVSGRAAIVSYFASQVAGGAMEREAQTLRGKLSNITDAFIILSSKIGEAGPYLAATSFFERIRGNTAMFLESEKGTAFIRDAGQWVTALSFKAFNALEEIFQYHDGKTFGENVATALRKAAEYAGSFIKKALIDGGLFVSKIILSALKELVLYPIKGEGSAGSRFGTALGGILGAIYSPGKRIRGAITGSLLGNVLGDTSGLANIAMLLAILPKLKGVFGGIVSFFKSIWGTITGAIGSSIWKGIFQIGSRAIAGIFSVKGLIIAAIIAVITGILYGVKNWLSGNKEKKQKTVAQQISKETEDKISKDIKANKIPSFYDIYLAEAFKQAPKISKDFDKVYEAAASRFEEIIKPMSEEEKEKFRANMLSNEEAAFFYLQKKSKELGLDDKETKILEEGFKSFLERQYKSANLSTATIMGQLGRQYALDTKPMLSQLEKIFVAILEVRQAIVDSMAERFKFENESFNIRAEVAQKLGIPKAAIEQDRAEMAYNQFNTMKRLISNTMDDTAFSIKMLETGLNVFDSAITSILSGMPTSPVGDPRTGALASSSSYYNRVNQLQNILIERSRLEEKMYEMQKEKQEILMEEESHFAARLKTQYQRMFIGDENNAPAVTEFVTKVLKSFGKEVNPLGVKNLTGLIKAMFDKRLRRMRAGLDASPFLTDEERQQLNLADVFFNTRTGEMVGYDEYMRNKNKGGFYRVTADEALGFHFANLLGDFNQIKEIEESFALSNIHSAIVNGVEVLSSNIHGAAKFIVDNLKGAHSVQTAPLNIPDRPTAQLTAPTIPPNGINTPVGVPSTPAEQSQLPVIHPMAAQLAGNSDLAETFTAALYNAGVYGMPTTDEQRRRANKAWAESVDFSNKRTAAILASYGKTP